MKKILIPILAVGLPVFASEVSENNEESNELGIEFSVDYWVAFPDGNINVEGKNYGMDTIGYDKAKDIGAKFIYEGLLDKNLNLVLAYTPIKFEAKDKEATSNISIKEFNVAPSEKYESKYDFNNYDFGLLYDIEKLKEKTEDRLDIRVGASLRYLNASMEFKAENGSEYKKDYSSLKPMFDIEAETEVLPVNQDLTAEIILELQSYVWNGEYLHDFIDSARVNYKHFFVEAGYRVIKYKLKDGDIKSKNTAEGFFSSVGVMF